MQRKVLAATDDQKTQPAWFISSTTSRQSPVLKLNLYLPLLPFPAPDTAITIPRTKAGRYWTRVLIKCAGTASAQVTTPTFILQPVCCVSYEHSSLSGLLPKYIQKGYCIIAITLYFSRNEPKHLARAKRIQKAVDELPTLHWLSFTVRMCDVVIPTPSNSEKLSPFFYLLTFFLLYWEEGFANNSHLLV